MKTTFTAVALLATAIAAAPLTSAHADGWHHDGWHHDHGGGLVVGVAGAVGALITAPFYLIADVATAVAPAPVYAAPAYAAAPVYATPAAYSYGYAPAYYRPQPVAVYGYPQGYYGYRGHYGYR